MKLGLTQFAPSGDKKRNREVCERLVREAVSAGATVVVLPEEAMCVGPENANLADTAEGLDGPFVQLLAGLAREGGVTIVAGMHERVPMDDARAYNTLVVVAPSGDVVGAYRKLHLFDAFGFRESDRVKSGDGPPLVVTVDDLRIGILNCYDIRFPELARLLIDEGADVLLVAAAWATGKLKDDHWRTLLRARAIENTCWVGAADQSGQDCVGLSMLVDPMGVVRASLGEEPEGVLVSEIALDRTADVRGRVPSLSHRRFPVSRELAAPGERG